MSSRGSANDRNGEVPLRRREQGCTSQKSSSLHNKKGRDTKSLGKKGLTNVSGLGSGSSETRADHYCNNFSQIRLILPGSVAMQTGPRAEVPEC